MKQILITRFAMRFKKDNPRRRYEERGDWIDYRIKLFNKYCLPSAKAQTVDFDWWFLVHPEFPGFSSTHKEELLRHGRILWIEAPWKEDQVEVGGLLSEEYKDRWVCSTRFDSDDILRNNFLETVSKSITEKEAWVVFPEGFMMKDNKAVPRTYSVNPFISYVEYADPFYSVFKINHMAVNKQDSLIEIKGHPAWIQVDHRDNIKNHIKHKITDYAGKQISAELLRKHFTWK